MTSIFNKPKTAASGSRSVVRTGTSAYVSAFSKEMKYLHGFIENSLD